MFRFKLKVRDTLSDFLLGGRVGVDIEVDIGVRDMKNFGQEYAETPDIILCAVVLFILDISSYFSWYSPRPSEDSSSPVYPQHSSPAPHMRRNG